MEKKTTPQHPPSPSPSLPYDLLREVLERCDDHETLVRCAASSKLLSRLILDCDPSIIRRRASVGFAPSLLVGVFHQSPRGGATRFTESPTTPTVVVPPRHHQIRSFVSRNAGDLLAWFHEPVACRGGLLVLRRDRDQHRDTVDLCVCNPITGDCGFLPRPEVFASSVAILAGDEDDAGSGSQPFQLLAVDQVHEPWGEYYKCMTVHIRSQLFSSPAGSSSPATMPSGAWGPVRRAWDEGYALAHGESPVIIDRVSHWLRRNTDAGDYHILALDADEGGTELIDGPREIEHLCFIRPNHVLLASTPDRRLSIVVVEELVISMFVLSLSEDSKIWERRAVVVREGILAPPHRMSLEFFGERSGTVVITMPCQPGWLLLNLETKEVLSMCPDAEEDRPRWRWVSHLSHLFEMDLPSLAAAILESPDSSGAGSSKLTIKFGQVLATVDIARAVKPCKTFIGANLLKKNRACS